MSSPARDSQESPLRHVTINPQLFMDQNDPFCSKRVGPLHNQPGKPLKSILSVRHPREPTLGTQSIVDTLVAQSTPDSLLMAVGSELGETGSVSTQQQQQQQILQQKQKEMYALQTFARNGENLVCVLRGDKLILLNDENNYWWLVRTVKTGEIGYVPADIIETAEERIARINKQRNIRLTTFRIADIRCTSTPSLHRSPSSGASTTHHENLMTHNNESLKNHPNGSVDSTGSSLSSTHQVSNSSNNTPSSGSNTNTNVIHVTRLKQKKSVQFYPEVIKIDVVIEDDDESVDDEYEDDEVFEDEPSWEEGIKGILQEKFARWSQNVRDVFKKSKDRRDKRSLSTIQSQHSESDENSEYDPEEFYSNANSKRRSLPEVSTIEGDSDLDIPRKNTGSLLRKLSNGSKDVTNIKTNEKGNIDTKLNALSDDAYIPESPVQTPRGSALKLSAESKDKLAEKTLHLKESSDPKKQKPKTLGGIFARKTSEPPAVIAMESDTPSKEENTIFVLKIWSGNLNVNSQYVSMAIRDETTVADVVRLVVPRFRIPGTEPHKDYGGPSAESFPSIVPSMGIDPEKSYYLSYVHGDSKEKRLQSTDKVVDILDSLKSKSSMPGIASANKDVLKHMRSVNAQGKVSSIRTPNEREIKFLLYKGQNIEKETIPIRVYYYGDIFKTGTESTCKTIAISRTAPVSELLRKATTKFMIDRRAGASEEHYTPNFALYPSKTHNAALNRISQSETVSRRESVAVDHTIDDGFQPLDENRLISDVIKEMIDQSEPVESLNLILAATSKTSQPIVPSIQLRRGKESPLASNSTNASRRPSTKKPDGMSMELALALNLISSLDALEYQPSDVHSAGVDATETAPRNIGAIGNQESVSQDTMIYKSSESSSTETSPEYGAHASKITPNSVKPVAVDIPKKMSTANGNLSTDNLADQQQADSIDFLNNILGKVEIQPSTSNSQLSLGRSRKQRATASTGASRSPSRRVSEALATSSEEESGSSTSLGSNQSTKNSNDISTILGDSLNNGSPNAGSRRKSSLKPPANGHYGSDSSLHGHGASGNSAHQATTTSHHINPILLNTPLPNPRRISLTQQVERKSTILEETASAAQSVSNITSDTLAEDAPEIPEIPPSDILPSR